MKFETISRFSKLAGRQQRCGSLLNLTQGADFSNIMRLSKHSSLMAIATCLLSLATQTADAQNLKGISFEPSFYYGSIIRHNDRFQTPITGNTAGAELNITIQTYGKKDWHERQHYPKFGLAISYLNFGDPAVFGAAIGALPNLSLQFLQKNRFYAEFRVGSGLAWLNRPYNPATNPENNAMGANLNTIFNFRLSGNWQFNDKWTLLSAASLTHYSNAASTLPNLGINIPAFNLGIKYTPQPLAKADYIHSSKSPEKDKRIHFGVYQGIAFKESQAAGGPKYTVLATRLSAHRYMSHNNRLHTGFEYEYANHTLAFIQHIGLFDTDEERRKNAQRAMFFVADEIGFGRTSIWLQVGTYFTRSYQQPWFLYTRLGMRYYPFIARKGYPRVHIGLYMKSHKEVAEYVDYGIGVTF